MGSYALGRTGATAFEQGRVELLCHSLDRRPVRDVKQFVAWTRLVNAVATGKGDQSRSTFADRLDAIMFGVAAQEDRLVGWIIRNSSSDVDRSVDQMPFEFE